MPPLQAGATSLPPSPLRGAYLHLPPPTTTLVQSSSDSSFIPPTPLSGLGSSAEGDFVFFSPPPPGFGDNDPPMPVREGSGSSLLGRLPLRRLTHTCACLAVPFAACAQVLPPLPHGGGHELPQSAPHVVRRRPLLLAHLPVLPLLIWFVAVILSTLPLCYILWLAGRPVSRPWWRDRCGSCRATAPLRIFRHRVSGCFFPSCQEMHSCPCAVLGVAFTLRFGARSVAS